MHESTIHHDMTVGSTDGALTDDQFRRFARTLSTVIWRMSATGVHLIAPRWAELTGLREHELQNHGWLASIHPDDRAPFSHELRDALAYGNHLEIDVRLRLRDGSFHWYRVRGEPSRGTHGEITGFMGVASNIDDQKRAEHALVENERRLRMVIDAARVGTIDHDLASGTVSASTVAKRMLGVPPNDQITFGLIESLVHSADRELFATAVERGRARESDGAFELVFRLMRTDGESVWVNIRGTYLFEGQGSERRAVRFVGVAADLTGHMRDLAERATMSAIVSSSQDAIIAVTPEGRITHWNAAATRIFGYAAPEAVGQALWKLIPDASLDECRARIAAVMRGEPGPAFTGVRLAKNHEPVDVSVTLSAIREESGRVVGVAAIMRDIRAQRRLELEVAQSQKMEAVGLLAAGVAHDINNTLTAILVALETAEQCPHLDMNMREEFRNVRTAGFASARLIRQLLAVARRQVIYPVSISLNEAIAELQPMLLTLLEDRITLDLTLDATRGAYVDPSQLSQIVLNLCVNARDAMECGGQLAIRTYDFGDAVAIEVRDTGCGMPPEVQARVFEPFFTTKPSGYGSGLGLSATYGIVAQSKGTISVASQVGIGTTFTITLPAVAEPRLACIA